MFLPVALLVSYVISINPSWQQLSSYSSVQTDPDYQYVCTIDGQQNGYCADTGSMNFYSVGGPFIQLVSSKGKLFGVDNNLNLRYSVSAAKDQVRWTESLVNTPFWPISTDGDAVCAPSGYKILCTRWSWGLMSPTFRVVTRKQVKQVEVKGDKLFVLHKDNTLAFAPFAQNTTWTPLPGSFSQIAYDGTVLVGVTPDGIVSVASSNLETNPDWQTVDGKMRTVAVGGGGKLVGIDYNYNVFAGAIPAQPPASN